ncbi:ChuX/HutX family heme-like substrate-binding protein [Roseibium aggregatum]|uniref:Haemin-degrading HemS/ChuX domain-containing protein n=1 Tax=Roseibium aggregatum TaxID=187304 RepID=A0A939EHP5_9HYPH|nr:ChuX/HutX family heme-like substrate-binding protein [Roseibium aggregatum]MBN9671739.1 hypothetical protein [Roseibium aggregatum]
MKLVVDNAPGARGCVTDPRHSDLTRLLMSADRGTRGLDNGVELLRDWLPSFSRTVATTSNDCAIMSEIGAYQKPMVIGEELTFDNSGIAIRLCPEGIETVAAVEADRNSREAPSLQLFEAGGRAVHKCHIASLSDQLAFDVLMYGASEKEITAGLAGAMSGFLSRTRTPSGKLPEQRFCQLGVSENLDTCLLDEGTDRRDRLGRLDSAEAWTIDRQVVPHALRYFCEMRMPLTVGVPARACMQLKPGRLDSVLRHGDLVELTGEANRTFFDPAAIDDYWVVRSGKSLSLEFYSKSGSCVLVFVQDRVEESRFNTAWMEILASLPRTDDGLRNRHA